MANTSVSYAKSPSSAQGAWAASTSTVNPTSAASNKAYTIKFTAASGYPMDHFHLQAFSGSTIVYEDDYSVTPSGLEYSFPWGPQSSWTSFIFTAVITMPTYTATFDINGGTGTAISSITGNTITLPTPTDWEKSGYYFSGWNSNAAGSGTHYDVGASVTLTANKTFYAEWSEIVYIDVTASFSLNGGTGTAISSITQRAGTQLTLPTPTDWIKGDKAFASWNTQSDGSGTSYNAGAIVILGTSDITYYAIYQSSGTAVKANYIHGTGITTYVGYSHGYYTYVGSSPNWRYDSGSTIPFKGYSENADLPIDSSDFTRYNHSRSETSKYTYYLSYYYNMYRGGTTESSLFLDYTSHCLNVPTTGTVLPSDGYLRYFWVIQDSSGQKGLWNFEGSTSFYGTHTDVTSGVTVDGYYDASSSYTLGIGIVGQIKTGYYSDWTIDYDGNPDSTPDFTVAAIDSLSHSSSNTVSPGGTFRAWSYYTSSTVTAPTISNWVFVGWYLNGGLVSTSSTYTIPRTTSSSNATNTLKAKYVSTESAVFFDPNGGQLTDPTKYSKNVIYLSTYGDLPTATYDSEHVFANWQLADGTVITSSSTVTTLGNHTLYAVWTTSAETCTVTFDFNGGTGSPASKTVTVGAAYGSLPSPTYAGHAFGGWYTGLASGTVVTDATVVAISYDHTVIARWGSFTRTITFDENHDSQPTFTQTYFNGIAYGTLPVVHRDGYVLTGWFTAATGGTQVTESTTVTADATLYAQWQEQAIFDPCYYV